MVLHRPLEAAGIFGNWDWTKKPVTGNPSFQELRVKCVSATEVSMSYRFVDTWSKEVRHGATVSYVYCKIHSGGRRATGWAGADVSGVTLEPLRDLALDLTRSQIESLFEPRV